MWSYQTNYISTAKEGNRWEEEEPAFVKQCVSTWSVVMEKLKESDYVLLFSLGMYTFVELKAKYLTRFISEISTCSNSTCTWKAEM